MSRGIFKNPEERIRKITQNHSRYWLGKKRPSFPSKETREKMSRSHEGKKPSLGKHWKMSEEIRRKSSKVHMGINSKGLTSKNLAIRQGIEFRLWREAVFARDNWTCQKTKIKGGKLHPHHIKNFAQHPELRFAIDNGITLSEKTHREFHKKYGIKNNTLEQLQEFLSNL